MPENGDRIYVEKSVVVHDTEGRPAYEFTLGPDGAVAVVVKRASFRTKRVPLTQLAAAVEELMRE